jgi:flavin reductase (DIM6/NTAB) family NADH-FMN oxidoreductase RutF
MLVSGKYKILREAVGMEKRIIPFNDLNLNVFKYFDKDWILLTAGELEGGKFNSMTISWGSIGFLWGKPMAHVVVRPSRYTYEFIDKYDTFTMCSFPEQYRKVLAVLGSKSGRDMDKINNSGLTPVPSEKIAAPSYEEANLILECRKSYYYDIKPERFLLDYIEDCYKGTDYHRCYIAEIVCIKGTDEFVRKV